MSEHADAGSVAADAQPAGNLANAQLASENGSAEGAAISWLNGLSEGNRKLAETKGWNSTEGLDKALTSYVELEQRQGSMIALPAADAPPEEWQEKVLSRLPEAMRPAPSPDKIEYKRPEGLPADLPYNDDLATASKQWAVDAKLSSAQAQVIHDGFVKMAAQQVAAQQAEIGKAVETTHGELVRAWGPQDSEGFKRKHELANRAMKKLGLVESYKAKGILLPDGALTEPQIAKAFAEIGERMFREDTVDHGSVPTGVNPFKEETKNVTQQSAIKKNDPTLARRLIREAGKDPRNFGL